MQNVNNHIEESIKSIYSNMFAPFFIKDFRVVKSFMFIDEKSMRNKKYQYTFEVMLNPDIVSSEVDLISLEINIIRNQCEFFFFSNDGNIFLNETEKFQCIESFNALVKNYTAKFLGMFENMISPYVKDNIALETLTAVTHL